MNWILIWKLFFIIGLSLFSILAIVVIILGFKDIQKLLSQLK